MVVKSIGQWERLVSLLKSCGYLYCRSNQVVGDYTYGPAGTLLRNNIKHSWWSRMVTSQESTYTVEGHSVKDPVECFQEVCDLMNRQVPFSLSQEQTLHVQEREDTECNKDKFIFNSVSQTHFKFAHFCLPSTANQTYDQIINTRLTWWKQFIGNPSSIQLTGIEDGEFVTGSTIQFQFPWGPETIETVLNKGDKQLKELEQSYGISYQCKNGKKQIHPHQIECISTLETAMAAFLADAYVEKLTKGKKKEPREILQLHPGLAPFKISVIASGTRGRELQEVATYISRELRGSGIKLLDTKDTTGQLEKHLMRNDRMGVPFTVIVGDSTLETGAVAVRNRDTSIRETLAINKLKDYIWRHITS